MSLKEEVSSARKQVITDGYEMSIGELINIYRDGELNIDPAFQRLFRWDDERKSRFIESILLGIPIPSIFVHQNEKGVWELVDGLQRVSTLLQLTGDLKAVEQGEMKPLVLTGTKLLPSLDGKMWKSSNAKDALDPSLQIEIKRARIRVEIIKSESDQSAKFELFQRLNTGGVELTAQEVRNSIAISINKPFFDWLVKCSERPSFLSTTKQTERATKSQAVIELALRFFAFRHVEYKSGLDVHEYLDDAMVQMASNKKFNKTSAEKEFSQTFDFLEESLGSDAFKKWNGTKFSGMFLMSAFEVISTGLAHNIAKYEAMSKEDRKDTIFSKVKGVWQDKTFKKNSGAGVRGTTRLSNLLPIAGSLMKP